MQQLQKLTLLWCLLQQQLNLPAWMLLLLRVLAQQQQQQCWVVVAAMLLLGL
jgi:hypothetical protein